VPGFTSVTAGGVKFITGRNEFFQTGIRGQNPRVDHCIDLLTIDKKPKLNQLKKGQYR
jgi:hypothetical protein